MNIDGMEIERKYLIAMPDEAVLQSADASEIVQTYLASPEKGVTERVRAHFKWQDGIYAYCQAQAQRDDPRGGRA